MAKIKNLEQKEEYQETNLSSGNWFLRNIKFFTIPILLFVTIIIYSNTLKSEFVLLDDTAKIKDNTVITELSKDNMKEMFSTFIFHTYFPVTLLSYAVDYLIWDGFNSFGFHKTNLFLHLINVLLLYFFAKKFTNNRMAGFIAALIFAAHPMNVESVSWLSERSNLLYTLFFLASMNTYLHYVYYNKNIVSRIFTYLFFILSLLAKSSAVMLPIVFILIDYYKNENFSIKFIFRKIPYLFISFCFGLVAIYASTSTENIKDLSVHYNILDRVFLAFYPLTVYIIKFFAPVNLSVLYPYPLKSGGFLPFLYYLSTLFILLVIFITLKFRTLKKELVFAFLFFFFNISLLLMVVPIGGNFLMAEHFVYVPYIGMAIVAEIIFYKIYDNTITLKIPKQVVLSIFYLLIPVFCIATYMRNNVWKNSTALFSDLVEKQPQDAYAHYSMGTLYMEKHDYENAIKEFNISIKLDNSDANAFYNRSLCFINFNKIDSSFFDADNAIKLNPKLQMAYITRGNVRTLKKDTIGAISDYSKAIELSDKNPIPYYDRGRMYMNTKKYSEALIDFNKAIELNSEYIDAYNNRGITYYFLGEYKKSIEDYNLVIMLDKNYAYAYLNRGLSEIALGDKRGACTDFDNAYDMGVRSAARYMKKYCY
ncbi:MAG TPA: tetratricopeptide repeat protein [Bacteroidales bacterium]|nr:tetratricopeptide repeat protein [Bacteroidales bacterium]HPS17116.1 tetratricopeptide repeat protein [Bacteroidales bacterium]